MTDTTLPTPDELDALAIFAADAFAQPDRAMLTRLESKGLIEPIWAVTLTGRMVLEDAGRAPREWAFDA
jgi:hypothetical protein